MDRDLVDGLFARYREPVYLFLRRLLRDAQAAEDLTQDAFVRALRASYSARGSERAWIFQIARNLARDHARAGRRAPDLVTLENVQASGDLAAAIELEAALSRLEPDDREVFLLKEIAGLSYDEIAAACGLTPDAVRSRLYRTRLALRAALSNTSAPGTREHLCIKKQV